MTGAEIRTARKRLGWSQTRLAGALGVHWVTVWRWEAGRSPVPHWVPTMLAAAVDTQSA
jgi:DNA-binding transcriptional regulator YiaG